jgi:hypothetical protein
MFQITYNFEMLNFSLWVHQFGFTYEVPLVQRHLAVIFPPGDENTRVLHSRRTIAQLFYMVEVVEIPIAEAANRCGINQSTARRYIRRAQKY